MLVYKVDLSKSAFFGLSAQIFCKRCVFYTKYTRILLQVNGVNEDSNLKIEAVTSEVKEENSQQTQEESS